MFYQVERVMWLNLLNRRNSRSPWKPAWASVFSSLFGHKCALTRPWSSSVADDRDTYRRYLPYQRPTGAAPPSGSQGARRTQDGADEHSAITSRGVTPGQKRQMVCTSQPDCKRRDTGESEDESTIIQDDNVANLSDLHMDEGGFRIMFEVVTSAVAVLDADGDGDLDCVVVVREHLDENKKTARYVWLLPSLNGRQAENLTYHLKEGPTPDKPVLTVDDGADGEKTANFIYTNYKNCVVVDIPFKKKRSCGLWVTKDAVHSVPQECVDQFEDNCDMEVAVFDDETCKGVLDNI
ncbi:hypothetical protein HPB49_010306 [Dermacentor silvarum]|uniref:Uncharacterized protein n=1 Tax=Dermacentor silvarum TaxID=543639 RepID=A0ACB8DCI0_DERSI|nr:hypothetical protein HPB49_010306 [Dermacentor silvarum]